MPFNYYLDPTLKKSWLWKDAYCIDGSLIVTGSYEHAIVLLVDGTRTIVLQGANFGRQQYWILGKW